MEILTIQSWIKSRDQSSSSTLIASLPKFPRLLDELLALFV